MFSFVGSCGASIFFPSKRDRQIIACFLLRYERTLRRRADPNQDRYNSPGAFFSSSINKPIEDLLYGASDP